MIRGIGMDMVDIRRIEVLLARHPARLEKLYSPQEIMLARSRKHPAATLAKRFAAKEAFAKALGTGMRGLRWRDVEVVRDAQGRPALALHGAAAQALGSASAHLSLSDEYPYAYAWVIVEAP